MVIVEDHDGGDDGGGNHEHDAVEIGSWNLQQSGLCICPKKIIEQTLNTCSILCYYFSPFFWKIILIHFKIDLDSNEEKI